jgi:hypothetical protein
VPIVAPDGGAIRARLDVQKQNRRFAGQPAQTEFQSFRALSSDAEGEQRPTSKPRQRQPQKDEMTNPQLKKQLEDMADVWDKLARERRFRPRKLRLLKLQIPRGNLNMHKKPWTTY